MAKEINMFVIYAREDKDIKLDLLRHLNPFKEAFNLSIWHDDQIEPGQLWKPHIESRLNYTDVFLLLVSVDFMNSEFIRQTEFKAAIDRHKANKSVVIPVIIDYCQWDIDFTLIDYKFNINELQVLPDEGKPVGDWNSPDQAYNNVAAGVRKVLTTIQNNRKLEEKEEKIMAKNKVEEEKRLADEAEAKRKAEEEQRLKAESEAKKKAEEEAARKKAEEEQRLKAEAEANKKAEEEATIKKAEEEKRLAVEAEAKRKAEEEKRLANEAEAKKKAEEEAARKKAEEEKRLANEAEAKRKAEEAKKQSAADATKSQTSTPTVKNKKSKLLIPAIIVVVLSIVVVVILNSRQPDQDVIAWETTQTEANTLKSFSDQITTYENYKNQFPDGKFIKDANSIIDSLKNKIDEQDIKAWNDTQTQVSNSESIQEKIDFYDAYLNHFPKGNHIETANDSIDYLIRVLVFLDLEIGDTYEGGIVFEIDTVAKIGKMAHLTDSGPMPWEKAMNIDDELGEGWRLPSYAELQTMYKEIGQGKTNSGQFKKNVYWSSDPYGSSQARLLSFEFNSEYQYNKMKSYLVRAIKEIKF